MKQHVNVKIKNLHVNKSFLHARPAELVLHWSLGHNIAVENTDIFWSKYR